MKLMNGLLIAILSGGTLFAQAPAPAKTPAPGAAKPATQAAKTPAVTAAKAPVHSTTAQAPKPAAPATKPAPVAAKAPATTNATAAKPAPVTKAPVAAQTKPVATATPAAKPAAKPVDKPAAAEKKSAPFAPKPATAAVAAKPASAPAAAATPAAVKLAETSRVSAVPANRRDPFISPIVKASGGGPVCETGKRCLMVDQIALKGIVKSPNGYIAVVENAAKRAYFLRENDPVFNGSVVKITGDTIIFREQTVDKLGKQSMREVTKKVNAPVV
jgi:hypothetical protein